MNKPLSFFLSLSTLFIFAGMALLPQEIFAHKGHSGPKIVFVKKKEALKQMFSTDAKIVQRKEKLDSTGKKWAKNNLKVKLDKGIYTYFLARDPDNGKILGAAMITDIEYRHGDASLIVGIDEKGNITETAILSVHQKYVPALKESIGVGFLPQFSGMSLETLVFKTRKLPSYKKLERLFFSNIRDVTALLVTFVNSQKKD